MNFSSSNHSAVSRSYTSFLCNCLSNQFMHHSAPQLFWNDRHPKFSGFSVPLSFLYYSIIHPPWTQLRLCFSTENWNPASLRNLAMVHPICLRPISLNIKTTLSSVCLFLSLSGFLCVCVSLSILFCLLSLISSASYSLCGLFCFSLWHPVSLSFYGCFCLFISLASPLPHSVSSFSLWFSLSLF